MRNNWSHPTVCRAINEFVQTSQATTLTGLVKTTLAYLQDQDELQFLIQPEAQEKNLRMFLQEALVNPRHPAYQYLMAEGHPWERWIHKGRVLTYLYEEEDKPTSVPKKRRRTDSSLLTPLATASPSTSMDEVIVADMADSAEQLFAPRRFRASIGPNDFYDTILCPEGGIRMTRIDRESRDTLVIRFQTRGIDLDQFADVSLPQELEPFFHGLQFTTPERRRLLGPRAFDIKVEAPIEDGVWFEMVECFPFVTEATSNKLDFVPWSVVKEQGLQVAMIVIQWRDPRRRIF